MNISANADKGVLLLVAGMKGAIGSSLAAAAAALTETPELVLPYLMTGDQFPSMGDPSEIRIAGWDVSRMSLAEATAHHGVLEKGIWAPYANALNAVPVQDAPDIHDSLARQVDAIKQDIREFTAAHPGFAPVLVNLLPAGKCHDLDRFANVSALYNGLTDVPIADLPYVLAAVESGIPVANFTPNAIEIPAVVREAENRGIPIAGRDGKTGQTYLKMVLASAFRARKLFVNGWYSLNILGNADGENLLNPDHAACKLTNKTDVLEHILGYQPGVSAYGKSAHKVHIDYYPPRGDAKEAWDVIDFEGVFGLPMSLRLNLQGRDSILAVPLVIDLARWLAALTVAGRAGLVPELGFYFKKAVGGSMSGAFEDQVAALSELARFCDSRLSEPQQKKGMTL